MALLARPGGGQEGVDDGERVLGAVHPAADAHQLGVVVLAGQARGLDAPGQGAAGAGHLVGGDLLAVAAAADDDAEAAGVSDDATGGVDAERRVVVGGVVHVRSAVEDLVTGPLQVVLDVVLQLEAGMVGTQIYAHGCDCVRRSSDAVPGADGVRRERGGRLLPKVQLMQFDDSTSPPTAHPGQPREAAAGPNRVAALTGWDPRVGPPGWAPQTPYSPPPPPVVQHSRGLSPYGMPARHSWEIPLLVIVIVVTTLGYLLSMVLLLFGEINDYMLLLLGAPILLYLGRGLNYATQRVNAVRMSPTQFPEGYRMVVEAAQRFGMATVPDAYVITGNGQINAFASGHGFRRYVVVYSDLFEVGGQARDPDALAFIIGHEVGHIAAGHVSYWRQLGMFLVPFLPILGNSLIRSQEYTADNHGYCNRHVGAPGAMRTLAAGKWLNPLVGFDEMADRAGQEKGFFVWVANAMSSHPVLTWRMWALRDRSRHGKLFWRPSAPPFPPNSARPQGFPRNGGPGYPQSTPPTGTYYSTPGQPLPPTGQNPGTGHNFPTTGQGYPAYPTGAYSVPTGGQSYPTGAHSSPTTGQNFPAAGQGYPPAGPASSSTGPGSSPPEDGTAEAASPDEPPKDPQ